MKLSFTSILFIAGLLTMVTRASGQSIIIANGTPNPACGNKTFVLALSGCSGCTITRWEEVSVPSLTVVATYAGASTYTANLTAPAQKYFRPVFTRQGSSGEFDVGMISITTDVAPVMGTLSTPTTSFLDSGSGQLTLTSTTGKLTWSHIGPPSSDVNGAVTSNFNITSTTSFYATVASANGGCPSVQSNTVAVNVYKSGVLTGSSSVVEGGKLNLSSTGNIIRWEYSIDAGTTWTNFDYASYTNGVVTGDKLADTHEIWTNTKFRVYINRGPFGNGYTNTMDVAYIPYTQANPNATNGANYIRAAQVTVTGITDPQSVTGLTSAQKRQVTSFQDGLGRSVQQNIQQGSPLQKDLIAVNIYDSKGREAAQYLPYVSQFAAGDYHANSFSEQAAYYINGTGDKVVDSSYPFAKKVFDSSPMGRLLEAGNAGQEYQPGNGHSTRISYSNNDASEIRVINADLTSTGFYSANALSKIETTDPDGKKTQTLTDNAGRTIVSRTQLDESIDGVLTPWLETYYIYNPNGSLKYIIPPKGITAVKAASWVITTAMRDQYFHQFVYDKFGRLVEKKVPGQAWTYYCYDRLDRVILLQNAYTRNLNKWLYIKYDRKNRPVMQGLYTNTTYTTRADIQLNVIDPLFALDSDKYYEDHGTAGHGYTNQCFPTTATELLIVNYYDSYDFDFNGTADYSYTVQGLANENLPATDAQVFGLPTGSKKLVLGTTTWLYSYVFYNSKGQPIQTRSNNHLSSAIDNLRTVVYDFEGKAITSKIYHNAGAGRVTTVINKMQYDPMGRITAVYQNNNGAATDQLLAKYEYNELGQLVDKKLHETTAGSNSFLQSVDFRYSIQGWLSSINNAQITSDGVTNDETTDYFGMELLYEKTETGLTTASDVLYNGNISAVKWKAPATATGAADQHSYKFTYDKANRFKTATSQVSTLSAGWTKEVSAIDEVVTGYDVNGNIMGLQRNQRKYTQTVSGNSITTSYGNEPIDNLAFTYASGNVDQLMKVIDTSGRAEGFNNGASGTADDFSYDAMGSILSDANKGSNIVYNDFGKPVQVTLADGSKVEYVYDAGGTKLTMRTYGVGGVLNLTTDYVDGYVYENSVLSFFSSPEGRVVRNAAGALEYQYMIADHQGNTRVVFSSVTPAAQSVTATFETTAQSTEAMQFQNYPSGAYIDVINTNNSTPGGTKSLHLNGFNAAGQVGVAKNYKVFPGDQISIEAYARYNSSSGGSNLSNFATALLAAFQLSAPVQGETGTASSAINYWGTVEAGGHADGTTDNAHPKAFVNIILFDKNYNFLDVSYAQVTSSGSPAYVSASYTVKEAGYAYVYVSNENPTLVDVYFDDVKMTYLPTNIIQYNEYYPFGLQTSASWTRDNSKNSFLYNEGSELNPTTGWYEMEFRNYDPALGRLTAIDPMATRYASFSGYHYAYNNPVIVNDPSGADPNYGCNCPDQSKMTNAEWIAYSRPGGPTEADYLAFQWAAESRAIAGATDELGRTWGYNKNGLAGYWIDHDQTSASTVEGVSTVKGRQSEFVAALQGVLINISDQIYGLGDDLLLRKSLYHDPYLADLKSGNSIAQIAYNRHERLVYARSQMSPLGRSMSNYLKSVSKSLEITQKIASGQKSLGMPNTQISGLISGANVIRALGVVGVAYSASVSADKIVSSGYNSNVIVSEVTGWSSAVMMGSMGATYGAALGPAGALLGGIIGGAIGYYVGSGEILK